MSKKICGLCSMPITEEQSKITLEGVTYHKPCPKEKNQKKSENTKYNKPCQSINHTLASKTVQNTYSKPEKSNVYNNNNNNAYAHPYGDFNKYEDDSDYKQYFYHKFSDPWKVRNDVENNGHIVSEFGEVFSPEQIKYYKKLGYDINHDSNMY